LISNTTTTTTTVEETTTTTTTVEETTTTTTTVNPWNVYDFTSISNSDFTGQFGKAGVTDWDGTSRIVATDLNIGTPVYYIGTDGDKHLITFDTAISVDMANYIAINTPPSGSGISEKLGTVTFDSITPFVVTTTTTTTEAPTTTTTTDAPTTTTVNPNYFNSITWDGVSELSKGGPTEYLYSFTFDPDLTRLESEFGIPTNSRISIVACPPGTVEPSISSEMSVIDIYGFGAPYDPTDYPQGTTVARNEYYNTYGTYEVVFKICIFDYVDGDFNYSETIGTDYPQTFNLSAAYPA
jgi:hypothetical protein